MKSTLEKGDKVKKYRDKKNEHFKWEKKSFIISMIITVICSIFTAILGFMGGKSTSNYYYGDVITYQMYNDAIEDEGMTEQETKEAYNISVGKSIAIFAIEYCVGKPYIYGGTSLKEGSDAAGLVLSVYGKYGIELPHSSNAIAQMGKEVNLSEIRDGDIVCYDGHVGIYVGENMIVHASNPRRGVVMDSMYYNEPITIRRFDFAEAQGNN